jgi:hypothetical protein
MPQEVSQYRADNMTFYERSEVALNKRNTYRYLGEQEKLIDNRAYTTEEKTRMLEEVHV